MILIMKSEWERIEMNGNVIGCDIGVGFDSISAIQHWRVNERESKWMEMWLVVILELDSIRFQQFNTEMKTNEWMNE